MRGTFSTVNSCSINNKRWMITQSWWDSNPRPLDHTSSVSPFPFRNGKALLRSSVEALPWFMYNVVNGFRDWLFRQTCKGCNSPMILTSHDWKVWANLEWQNIFFHGKSYQQHYRISITISSSKYFWQIEAKRKWSSFSRKKIQFLRLYDDWFVLIQTSVNVFPKGQIENKSMAWHQVMYSLLPP